MRVIFKITKFFYIIISLCTLVLFGFLITDRIIGLRKPSSNLLDNKTPGKFYLEDIFSFQKSVALGNGFYAYPTMDTSQGILTKIEDIEPKYKIFSWLCTEKCSGIEERNPILYDNKAYSINSVEMVDGFEGKFVDIFDFNTGKISFDLPIYAAPIPIQNLDDRQIYGVDSLPSNMERIDYEWIVNSNLPLEIIRIGNSCIYVGIFIYILHFLFGGLFLVMFYLHKSYSG